MRNALVVAVMTVILGASCSPTSAPESDRTTPEQTAAERPLINPSDAALGQASERALWLRSSAISPDGKMIAFSYRGNIHLVDAQGGAARPLTTGAAYAHLPVWSPDGRHIAYASAQNGNFDIYLIATAGGAPRRLTHHSADDTPTAFSPDGTQVLFTSTRVDPAENRSFPSRVLPELYRAAVDGSGALLVMDVPAIGARWDKSGKKLIYYDRKGYESHWRKHHQSSIARDVWLYDATEKRHKKLTDFPGEDREPLFSPDGSAIYYLSEKSGSFNVWRLSLAEPAAATQLTSFSTHPVRYLSATDTGTLCFSWDGELYTLETGGTPKRVDIFVAAETGNRQRSGTVAGGDISEAALSPSGKELAFIYHGEVYVSSIETDTTRRITETPEEERWLSFNKEGTKLLYASERSGSWNIYETVIADPKEPFFIFATIFEERALVEDPDDTFQPGYSPDGKKIAFFRKRTELVVRDIASGRETVVLERTRNISYVDGDQWYHWSPDSTYLAVSFIANDRWAGEVGIVPADGREPVVNLSENGFDDMLPQWSQEGGLIYFFSNRSAPHLWGQHLNRESFDRSLLSKEEFDLLVTAQKEKEKEKKEEKKEKEEKKKAATPPKPVKLELDNKESRLTQLTTEPFSYIDAVLSNDGEKLYTLDVSETTYSLRETLLREKKSRVVTLLPRKGKNERDASRETSERTILVSPDEKTLFVLVQGAITAVDVAAGTQKPVPLKIEFSVDLDRERAFMFEHVWHTMNEKFYRPDMHGVDWKGYRTPYHRFLPHITNNFDFTEMLSEMLGELNVSHTGSGYRFSVDYGDSTAALGLLYGTDPGTGGIRIVEVVEGSPCDRSESRIAPDTILEKVNRRPVADLSALTAALNRAAGIPIRLSLFDPKKKTRWEETVKPITLQAENELLYERWVKRNAREVTERSKGKLGYIHVRGMNQQSFKRVFGEIMGKYHEKEGIVIDTRFNGGGWLHNDLSILFNGKPYARFEHRGIGGLGGEPNGQWAKKSILLVSESNYSDAHFFPFAYRALGLGKIVGMPVPGTSTAVWWPHLIDRTIYFGIPQIGIRDNAGNYLENAQIEPDILVENTPETYTTGHDRQLEKSVDALLEEIMQESGDSKKKP